MNLGSPWSQEATQLRQQPWSPPVLILQGALFAESLAERAQHVIIFSVASWQVHTASLQRLAWVGLRCKDVCVCTNMCTCVYLCVYMCLRVCMCVSYVCPCQHVFAYKYLCIDAYAFMCMWRLKDNFRYNCSGAIICFVFGDQTLLIKPGWPSSKPQASAHL